MNGFIKFEVKKLKTKKIVNVHFRNCCANNCQILIEEFIYIRRWYFVKFISFLSSISEYKTIDFCKNRCHLFIMKIFAKKNEILLHEM